MDGHETQTNSSWDGWDSIKGALALVIGAFLLVGLAWQGYTSWNLVTNGVVVTGSVVDYVTVTNEDSGDQYKPAINYTVDGQMYTEVGDTSYQHRPYPLGTQIELLVNPERPRQATINDFSNLWTGAVIYAGALVVLIFISLVIWFRDILLRWQRKRSG